MEIRKKLVDPSKYGIKCPYTMNPEFITVHNTYNDATAENEVSYMIRNDNQVSFHIAVDDKEAVQGIPLERNAWHCGDGGGNGNRKSIGVEICYSLSGGDRYYKAEDNAAIVVAQLMKQYNIPISKVRTHQSWSGKYCPHRMLDEGRWNSFIERVQNAYNGGGNNMKWTMKSGGLGVNLAQEIMDKLAEFKVKGNLVYEADGIFYLQCEPVDDRNKLGAITWYFRDYKGWYCEVYQV
ncbi:N-acetylmuramoyl-L-alanine amidase family protein [Bacillus cereus]|uniref:peptidoglycan recognition protein family protein n=1 Tax=Bacillus thuringiensis TaxID=1428 RepID=UPI000676BB84|nr:N-acetylmuramoyl-L-alanine amidase family protein [Bacillus thuringiensis]MEB8879837.1 N-acetylmuramoyl-L-alanine amidase family protein [Bacillus cereus]AKR35403.1 N-acetylmuramoyl-L-alanine amidase CwlA [Bacillus thuringiensis serovar indiana]MBG9643407.1 N-acetylmuramoyl-L-alanine amidase [Bacillus thuringiensis]MBG9650252.1 N-acetylmuramoyl-L-alanine amidase [Bacillus thuringiensis]MEB9643661.1 N-acetylmuramoyl-L-alanine amidase family protein [Bacillus cereus]